MKATTYEWAEALTLPEDEKVSLMTNIFIDFCWHGTAPFVSTCSSRLVVDSAFVWSRARIRGGINWADVHYYVALTNTIEL